MGLFLSIIQSKLICNLIRAGNFYCLPCNLYKMKTFKLFYIVIGLLLVLNSCGTDEDVDTTKPTIDLSIQDAFPINCDTIYYDEVFHFSALLSDNVELGSYSITIHNNFDHHSHTTEISECELDSVKVPVNLFSYIQDFSIPAGSDSYTTEDAITLASANDDGDYDDGDYHFFISVTDAQGWSTQKGLSVKIMHR